MGRHGVRSYGHRLRYLPSSRRTGARACGGAGASRVGMTVFVPEGELEIFADPVQHFRERQSYIVYDNIWDHFAPIEPANVQAARDYDTLLVNGLQVTVVPLPGVTPNHCGYALVTPVSKLEVMF